MSDNQEILIEKLLGEIKNYCDLVGTIKEKHAFKKLQAIKNIFKQGNKTDPMAKLFLKSLPQEVLAAVDKEIALWQINTAQNSALTKTVWYKAWQRYFKKNNSQALEQAVKFLVLYGYSMEQAIEIAQACDVKYTEPMIKWLIKFIKGLKQGYSQLHTEEEVLKALEIFLFHAKIEEMDISRVLEILDLVDFADCQLPKVSWLGKFFIIKGSIKAISYGFLPQT